MRVAVVLSAGGAPGWAFHTGVAKGLEAALDMTLADVDLVIGTSAGSVIGSAGRGGARPDDVLREMLRPPSAEERQAYRREMAARERSWLQRVRPASWRLARHALPGGDGLGLVAAGVLPAGHYQLGPFADFEPVSSMDWPDGLWLPAVRIPDGETVVFGRDRADVSVFEAVRASSSIPGMFRPQLLNGELHVDGATASSTHADLVIERSPDLVLIASVQGRPGHPLRHPFRAAARRRLAEEVAQLDAAGINHVVVGPDESFEPLFDGFPRQNPEHAVEIVARAEQLTVDALTRPTPRVP